MMNSDAAYWAEVEAIFELVVDLDGHAREAALDARCQGRPGMRAEVEAILAADGQADRLSVPDAPTQIGSTVGPFRLIEAIGAGGMGTVYRAERADGTFAQQVAVKVIATSVDHAGTAHRFRAERQILASLRHPNIVSLLDGGVTSHGQAYLVMEYVDGVPIAEYCAKHALPLADRLRLFRAVCSAVHYAHRHAVVHRDLKPANILVTADAAPKVLDFGVAKLLDESTAAGSTATLLAPAGLTPNYASPEQFRCLTVTTSSDVYALGILLYELLTDVRPYETEGQPLDEVMRLVVESDPPRPSSRTRVACSALPYEPNSVLKGDLDAIVRRAIDKQPERRYGSAEELAEDVGRFLAGIPVAAREPSFGYVVQKLAARHKAAFVSIGVCIVVIVAALVVAISQARIATTERRRAERRFSDVRQLSNALIFEIHDLVAPLPGSTPVRSMIVTRALRYLEQLAQEAQGDAALQLELAGAYIQIGRVQGSPGRANLGDPDGAIQSFRRAQRLLDPLVKAPNPDAGVVSQFVEATRSLAGSMHAMPAHKAGALAEARKAVDAAEAYLERTPANVRARNLVASATFMAALAADMAPASLPLWERSGAIYEALLAERADTEAMRNVALVQKYLGTYHQVHQDYERALSHYERARVLDEQRLSQNPTDRITQLDVALDLSNVADIRWRRGERAAAALFERSLAMRQALADSDPKDEFAQSRVAYAREYLARIYRDLNELPRALEHGRAALQIHETIETKTRDSVLDVARLLSTLGDIESAMRRRDAACASYERSFMIYSSAAIEDRTLSGADPLPAVAQLASACGEKSAQAWLTEFPTTSQRERRD
jgi:non-specific serine/threonine protein kinase/serine/threonine-protein kinase